MDPKSPSHQQAGDHRHQKGGPGCGTQPGEEAHKRGLPVGGKRDTQGARSGCHCQKASASAAQQGNTRRVSTGYGSHKASHEPRAPKRSLAALASIWAVHSYRILLGPLLGGGCRFHPSCSQYALDAFQKYGYWVALGKVLKRLCKCHPFHPGGYDPA